MKQRNPRGWPKHLMDYDPEGHRERSVAGVRLYPYDTASSHVKSYVAIRDGRYLGIAVLRPGLQVVFADGRPSVCPEDLPAAVAALLAPRRRSAASVMH